MVILNLDNIVHDEPSPDVEIPVKKYMVRESIVVLVHHNFQHDLPLID